MHEWLPQQLGRISGSSELTKAIRYSLNHWKGLTRFPDDGQVVDDLVGRGLWHVHYPPGII